MTNASPRPLGRARRILVRLGVLSLSTVLALVLGEALVQRLNLGGVLYYAESHRYVQQAIQLVPEADRPDGRIFQNRPGVDLALHDFDYRTDGLGLRVAAADAAALPTRREGVPRLLFLGDSVTLGWGVDDEHTWVRQLERRLADEGRPVECLNAGHLQYNTLQEADWFRTHGSVLAPDLVVLTFVVNDLDDAYATFQELKAAAAGPAEPSLGARLEGSLRGRLPGLFALGRLARERRGAIAAERAAEVVDPTSFPAYDERAGHTRLALDDLLARCDELGAELLVLDHSQPQLPVAERWCAERGVLYHDLRFTPDEWAQDIRVSLADAHANELGNRYLADKARAALERTALLGGD